MGDGRKGAGSDGAVSPSHFGVEPCDRLMARITRRAWRSIQGAFSHYDVNEGFNLTSGGPNATAPSCIRLQKEMEEGRLAIGWCNSIRPCSCLALVRARSQALCCISYDARACTLRNICESSMPMQIGGRLSRVALASGLSTLVRTADG